MESIVRKTGNMLKALRFTGLSILLGLVVGAVVLAIAGYDPLEAYIIIIKGIFSQASFISFTIISATPLIMTGLSVAFSFRTGLFNIGAEGQYIVGSLTAALLGAYIRLPAIIHIPICLLGAMLAGGLWGAIAGILKARFSVNEVISTIMLNWIALYLNNFVVTLPFLRRGNNVTEFIGNSARIDILPVWKVSEAGLAFREAHPIIGDVLRTPVNMGILLAITAAILIKFLLSRTTTGYCLRMVGDNINAAEYNGVDVRRNIVLAMFICGALAGAGGAFQVMGRTCNVAELQAMEGYGFNGIAVALIAANSPIGCVFSGLFFAALTYGGPKIQVSLGAPREVINIVIGTIILFMAMPKMIVMIKELIRRRNGRCT